MDDLQRQDLAKFLYTEIVSMDDVLVNLTIRKIDFWIKEWLKKDVVMIEEKTDDQCYELNYLSGVCLDCKKQEACRDRRYKELLEKIEE